MRGTWLALILILVARVAHAGHSIIVMSEGDRVAALGSAVLQILAGRGIAIATLPQPVGELRLERAAAAQRAALQLGADAATAHAHGRVAFDVCAVTADGRAFRHAPLPPDLGDAAPRAFSAIATSLLDELVTPPEPATNVSVDVDVRINGASPPATQLGFAAEPSRAQPDFAAPGVVDSVPARGIPRTDRTLIEVGPMLSPVTAGVMGGVMFPLRNDVRLGVMAGGHVGLGGGVFVYNAAAELRTTVRGQRNHFDIGLVGGMASANDHSGDATIGYGGLDLAYTWEDVSHGTTLSFVPLAASDGSMVFPGLYAQLKWGFAL